MTKDELLCLATELAHLRKAENKLFNKISKAMDELLMEAIGKENGSKVCPREAEDAVCFSTCEFGAGCSKLDELNEF